MEGGNRLVGPVVQRTFVVFRNRYVAVVITVVWLVVFLALWVISGCPEMRAVVVVFFSELAGHEC